MGLSENISSTDEKGEYLIPDSDHDARSSRAREIVFLVPPGKEKERLDLFLSRHIPHATRSRVQKLISAGGVVIDGKAEKKAGHQVVAGERIVCTIPGIPAPRPEPEDIPLDIVYEDEAIIIVNKRAGMVVHPAHGNFTGTMVNALMHYSARLSSVHHAANPGILHRIDKDTSGLLVVAKTNEAHYHIAGQFMKHTIEREYWALVWGRFDAKTGVIELPVGRSRSDRKKMDVIPNGKYAHTTYTVLAEYDFISLVKLQLRTGRTHQIRVHMSHIRHPIFGDPTYGGRRIMYGKVTSDYKTFIGSLLSVCPRQALHAKTLGFRHPLSHDIVAFDSPLPHDMQLLLRKLRSYTGSISPVNGLFVEEDSDGEMVLS